MNSVVRNLGGSFYSLLLHLSLAFLASAVNFHAVIGDSKSIIPRNLLLQLFDLWMDKLDCLTAGDANHVIVMCGFILLFVANASFLKMIRPRKIAFTEKLHRTVDGGQTDTGIPVLYQFVQLFHREVPLGMQEDIQNRFSLARPFQTISREMVA